MLEPLGERQGQHADVGGESQSGELQRATALQGEQAVLAEEAQVRAEHQEQIRAGQAKYREAHRHGCEQQRPRAVAQPLDCARDAGRQAASSCHRRCGSH
jgi:hypothetical protein